jgi:hypothetical protein
MLVVGFVVNVSHFTVTVLEQTQRVPCVVTTDVSKRNTRCIAEIGRKTKR